MSEFDRYFMSMALREAEKAAADGEVPTGCVIVEPAPLEGGREGEFDPDPCTARILARAHNQPEMLQDATAHAEMLALTSAAATKGAWRLTGTRLYVTKEPCPMCAGAIINSRIERVVYGAPDHKAGAFGTMINLTDYPLFKPQIEKGILAEECAKMLSDFFKNKR
jgi:tRNA(adenine34) deaminase